MSVAVLTIVSAHGADRRPEPHEDEQHDLESNRDARRCQERDRAAAAGSRPGGPHHAAGGITLARAVAVDGTTFDRQLGDRHLRRRVSRSSTRAKHDLHRQAARRRSRSRPSTTTKQITIETTDDSNRPPRLLVRARGRTRRFASAAAFAHGVVPTQRHQRIDGHES